MEVPEKLRKYKIHFLVGVVVSVAIFSLVLLAPRFLTVLAYFWPLFLSTALFLLAAIVFGKTSVPASDGSVDKTGEGLLHYVAGSPDHAPESLQSD